MKKLFNNIKTTFNDYIENGMLERTKKRYDYFITDISIATIIAIIIL